MGLSKYLQDINRQSLDNKKKRSALINPDIIGNQKKYIRILYYLLCIYIYIDITNIKFTTIPYQLNFGLIELLPSNLYIIIIIFTLILIKNIEEFNEPEYILNIILLSIFIWETIVLVAEYPYGWDSWGMGFITNQLFYQGSYSNLNPANPGLYYIGWPGFFILSTFLMHISGLDIIKYMELYEIIIIPISYYFIYFIFKYVSKNILISRYATLFFILASNYLALIAVPQSVSIILFIIILYYIFRDNSKNEFEWRLCLYLTLIALIITHPTMSFITIIYLAILLLLYLFFKIKYVYVYKILIFITVFFFGWFIYNASYVFSKTIKQYYIYLSSIYLTEGATTLFISKTGYYAPASKIRTFFFVLTFLISVIYLVYAYKKRNNILVFETVALLTTIIFAVIDINIFKNAFLNRIMLIGYFGISLIFGRLYTSLSSINNSKIIRLTLLLILIVTFTFYDHEIRNFYSYSYINGYGFALDKSYGKSVALDPSFSVAQPFLILNNNTTFGTHLEKTNISKNIDDYYIMVESDKSKWVFKDNNQIKEYLNFSTKINNNFNIIYDNSVVIVYLNSRFNYLK